MSAELALPAFYEIQADEAWTAIDFVSDLHLHAGEPETLMAWRDYLLRTRAQAVFILGDLFEAWPGDDAADEGFEAECVEALEEGAARVQLAFMLGNRDFLVGARLRQRAAITALADPTRLVAWNHPVLLPHGALLCAGDTEYQAFRRLVRSDAWQRSFLALPLQERRAQAQRMREGSKAKAQERMAQTGSAYTDIDTAMAVAWMHQAGCRSLVHGHTHRPGTEVLAPGYTRYVLTDWDLRATRPRAEVLRLTRDGFTRLPLSRT
ncbi:MAG: UDP-2,3-diacylglucosamine diphosphatase [Betaproteobacteria bacterium]